MIGSIIHNYRIEELLGEGGMGTVYRAVDTVLGRDVALKMLHPHLLKQAQFLERFKTEAQVLARLNHPNIAILYNFVQQGEAFYMAMEYVEGQTLEGVMHQYGALPPAVAAPIVRQALEGLAHAHRKGVLHRDIKPANLMLTPDGVVKIMDFGIAKIAGGQKMTQVNRVVGTLEYLSPEQLQGQDPSPQSDLYAMGVLLYELLTGKVPFQASTDYDLMKSIVQDKPAPIRKLDSTLPKSLEAAVAKALEKKPSNRYPDAHSFSEALAAVSSTQTINLNLLNRKPPTPATKVVGHSSKNQALETRVQDAMPTQEQGIVSKTPWWQLAFSKEYRILTGCGILALVLVLAGLLWKPSPTPPQDTTDTTIIGVVPTTTVVVPKDSGNNNSENLPPVINTPNQSTKNEPDPKPVNPTPTTSTTTKSPKAKEQQRPVEEKPKPKENDRPPKPDPVVVTEPPVTQKVNTTPDNTSSSTKKTGKMLSVPTGLEVEIILQESVSTDQLRASGTRLSFKVKRAVSYNGEVVILAGATAYGEITDMKGAGFMRKPFFEIRIRSVETVDGQRISLRNATFKEVASSKDGTASYSAGQSFEVNTAEGFTLK
ncbi:MAG: serine/threonine-protein kinase [Spirosomataceae bacterium]